MPLLIPLVFVEIYGKCLKRWRSVNQQIPCYTNYIIVWGTFYSCNSACIPAAESLTRAGNCLWSPDAPDGGCLASRSEDISDRCKHPVHWVWHSLPMYIIPHWPLLPWEYPQTAKALLAVAKGLILASHRLLLIGRRPSSMNVSRYSFWFEA